ncbi:hypothetical protein JCM19297_2606 [Nonlabens ulvanivorans]|nr:hypothetical protein [Nonlabens ulvanivorans]GAK91161.1 hypothetical protein JCM19297_2606 [Nonlabens ulvanivorans]
MTALITSIVLGILVLVGLAFLINKLPKKLHIIIIVFLLALIGYFGYELFDSIAAPVKFEKVKEERYKKVIAQLIKLREAENAHKTITGKYTDDINKLAVFVDTAKFALVQRRDSSVADREKNKRFGLNADNGGYYKEIVVTDTLGYKSVKDSLFQNINIATLLDYSFTTEGKKVETPGKISLETGIYFDDENAISVFEARAKKSDILFDQPERLLEQELRTKAVEGVTGEEIVVGSLTEVTTSGNWPRQYATSPK